jgi:hypothetical protein
VLYIKILYMKVFVKAGDIPALPVTADAPRAS